MSRRKKIETLALRSKIGRLYLSKNTQAEIGEVVGLTQQSVSLHLKELQKEWIESANKDFNLSRAIELAKIDRLEATAHVAWEASRKDKTTESIDTVSDVEVKTQTRTQSQYGNPRFLDLVLKCITKRCEILGLNAPTKLAATTPDGKRPEKGIGLVGLLREAERLKAEDAKEKEAEEKKAANKKH
ncbi:MAG: hypothetical protein AB1Y26_02920 [Cycloclasticus sp.]